MAAREPASHRSIHVSPGSTRPGFFSIVTRTPVRCVPAQPRVEQAVIPSQFESDSAPLVSSEVPPALTNTFITPNFSPVPSVMSTGESHPGAPPPGAPPPYAQVAPEEGGKSADEPPPPYPGPQ